MARFLVPQSVAGFLIGSSGARTRAYCERSGAKVWVAGQQLADVPGMRCVPLSPHPVCCLQRTVTPALRMSS